MNYAYKARKPRAHGVAHSEIDAPAPPRRALGRPADLVKPLANDGRRTAESEGKGDFELEQN